MAKIEITLKVNDKVEGTKTFKKVENAEDVKDLLAYLRKYLKNLVDVGVKFGD